MLLYNLFLLKIVYQYRKASINNQNLRVPIDKRQDLHNQRRKKN